MKNQAYLPSLFVALFFWSSCLFFTLSAQGGFSITPNAFDESYEDEDISNESHVFVLESLLSNTSNEPMDLKWERFILEPCPEEWNIIVFDGFVTYVPSVNTNSFPVQLSPGDTAALFHLEIYPRTVAGCCDIEIVFSDYNDPENVLDTVYYSIQINDALCSTTSSKEQAIPPATITVFPNPTAASFSLDTAVKMDRITLCNSLGERLKTFPLQENNTYSIHELPSGLYLLQYYQEGQLVGSSRLVKGIH